MQKLLRVNLVALCMVVIVEVAAASKRDMSKAEQFFRDGVHLYEKDDYTGAAALFEVSIKTFPTKMGYFNLANCYLALQEYGKARESVRALTQQFGNQFDEAWSAQIAEFETLLTSLSARLNITVDQPEADVQIGGKQVKYPSDEPHLLPQGEHLLYISKAGFEPVSETVTLAKGEEKSISIHMNPLLSKTA